MRRIYNTVALILAMTLVGAGTVAAQQDEKKAQQTFSSVRSPDDGRSVEHLWNQIAQLHKQIVAIQVGSSSAQVAPAPGRAQFETDRPKADSKENQPAPGRTQAEKDRPRTSDSKDKDDAKDPAAPRRSQVERDRPTTSLNEAPTPATGSLKEFPSIAGSDTNALWRRVAQIHRQLVAMEAGSSRHPQPDRAGPGNNPAKSDSAVDAAPSHADDALLKEFARLHQQIIRQDVQAASHHSGATATPPARRNPTDAPKTDRKPER